MVGVNAVRKNKEWEWEFITASSDPGGLPEEGEEEVHAHIEGRSTAGRWNARAKA